jgi:hypothetical protein
VHKGLVRMLASILVVVFPASMLMGDVRSAMLNATGDVTVNGVPVQQSTAIFPGDSVHTGEQAIATLTAPGTAVMIPANTVFVLFDNELDVACGTAMVSTSQGMSARLANVAVSPARGSAKFEVRQGRRELNVFAREGTLAVNDGRMLQPGAMLTAAAAGCSPGAWTPNGQAPPTPAAQNKGGAILIGVGVAALVALLVWLTTRSELSQTTPQP